MCDFLHAANFSTNLLRVATRVNLILYVYDVIVSGQQKYNAIEVH